VDIIAHSMGVVMARKAIKGGQLIATDGNCSLGTKIRENILKFGILGRPLSDRIDTFLGNNKPLNIILFKFLLKEFPVQIMDFAFVNWPKLCPHGAMHWTYKSDIFIGGNSHFIGPLSGLFL
jgi:hypothetical protein